MQYKDHRKALEMISNLSVHFTPREFACPCCKLSLMDDDLINSLEHIRGLYNAPIVIASGYRCTNHNIKIGGAPNSMHRNGKAVDIEIAHMNSKMLMKLIRLIHSDFSKTTGFKPFNGFGLGKNRLHIDVRGEPVAWTY